MTSTSQRVDRPATTAIAAAIAALGLAPAADAAIYIPEYDPVYGDAFPDLGWRARAELFVPDACNAYFNGYGGTVLFENPTTGTALGIPECNGAAFRNVEVFFYNVAVGPGTTIEYFDVGDYQSTYFAEDYGFFSTLRSLSFDIDGDLTAFDVTDSTPFLSDDPLVISAPGHEGGPGAGNPKFFSVQLSLSGLAGPVPDPFRDRLSGAAVTNSGFDFSGGLLKQVSAGLLPNQAGYELGRSGEASVRLTILTDEQFAALQVPEPGSLALVLAGLGAAFASGRRRRSPGA